jgi:hypothetical protein
MSKVVNDAELKLYCRKRLMTALPRASKEAPYAQCQLSRQSTSAQHFV